MLVTIPTDFLRSVLFCLTLFNLEGTQCRAVAIASERREPSYLHLEN
jgi:hypothetical protein